MVFLLSWLYIFTTAEVAVVAQVYIIIHSHSYSRRLPARCIKLCFNDYERQKIVKLYYINRYMI